MTGEIDPAQEPDPATIADEPIDADFEPITEDTKPPKAKGAGPGWMGVGLASLIAAGVGGAIGIIMDPGGGGNAAPDPAILTDLQVLKDAQSQTDRQLNKVTRDTGELETRLKGEMSNLLSGSESAEDLTPLIAELENVSKRLDEAMTNAGDPEAITLLNERLDALEAVDTSGESSPKELQRSVAGLTERVTQLDAAAEQLGKQMSARDATLERLSERLTEAEFSLEAVRDGETGAAKESVQALESELAELRAQISETSSASEEDNERIAALVEKLQASDTETRAQLSKAESGAEAALALSGIEAASRRGDGFSADFAKLSTALPGSAAVRTLRPFAKDGAPSLPELQAEFELAQAAAKTAGGETGADDKQLGWLNRAFGDAVTVRRKSDGAGASTDEILTAAETALGAGDLDGAINALDALQGAPASAMSDWMDRAKSRTALEAGLEALRLDLIGAER
jgi:hypothetical protein